ncbi:hypothetical protein [Rhizobium phage RHph_X2_28B]|uniref:hypothetical protein n=1 Tax=Rhizobium phage RHph_X2_28B TaxID=2836086 RepID=UPI0023293025|nr:hypothetical protein PP751_gp023 [Rhizobium phage RHph_X2_28B]QWY83475.1 hypothetical protein [Rhizobium phage RHph_X2_28B]QWY83711.1 hypothetical protein [Rhizobium phage RHph_X3_15]
MAQVSITLGKGSVLTLEDNNTLSVGHEDYGRVDSKVYLCKATKKDISAIQKYLEQMKVFVPDE